MNNEEHQVRQVVQSFYDTFNSHNFENAQEFTTPDWIHINPLGGRSEGREAVLHELKAVHSTFLKNVTDIVEDMSIRFAGPGVAVVLVPSTLSGTFTTPDGVTFQDARQIRTFVLVKVDDRWQIMHDQNTFRTI